MEERTTRYAETFARMIRHETVSAMGQTDKSKFYAFHDLLRELFPKLFAVCEFEDFDGSFLLRWKGSGEKKPILFMNHHDVVEAPGEWIHPPFSGEIADGKLWGRGALDTKGGLWAMLQAAEELCAEGYVPERDIYFESACNEEVDGAGARAVAAALKERGVHFEFSLDEGGMIVREPINGAKGTYAMIGMGEKGVANLKFIARGNGGHASTPGKDTPLVRLGKFMAAVEKNDPFTVEIAPVISEMLFRMSLTMKAPLNSILGSADKYKAVLKKLMPATSPTAAAMLKTTIAFTMAGGSEGANVLPQEAWIVGNMRFSHHQGGDASIRAITRLAKKYGVEVEVLEKGIDSPIADYRSEAFELVERGVKKYFANVLTTPYLMTGASDSRFMAEVSDNCLRFVPFKISKEQMASVHGLNENVDLSTLAPAVDFYKFVMQEA